MKRWLSCMWTSMLLFAPAGPAAADTLLVVRKSADALDFVDPGSGLKLTSVTVGHGPHEVSVAPDGRLAVVSNYGSRERPGSSVSIVDLAEPREVRRIELTPHTRPHGVAWFAPDRLAVTTEGSQHLLVLDPHAGRIVGAWPTWQETSHMVAVTRDGRRAYVANIGSGSVTAVTLEDDSGPRSVQTGAGTEALAVRPDGREVWVAARAAGRLVTLDTTTLTATRDVDLPGVPIRIAFDPAGTTAYATCAGSAEVVAFDASTGRELRRRRLDLPLAPDSAQRPFAGLAPGSALPVGLAVAPDGRSIYVAATMADKVAQLEAATLEVIRTIDVGGEPDGLALTTVMPQATCHACEAPGP